MRQMIRMVVLILVWVITPIGLLNAQHPNGFERYGYKQGMTLDQVRNVARSNGHTLKKLNIGDGNFWDIKKNGSSLFHISFCRSKLDLLSWTTGGKLLQNMKLIQQFVDNEGFRILHTSSSVRLSYENEDFGTLRFMLDHPNKTYFIEISLFASQKHDFHNGQATFERTKTINDNCN